MQRPVWLFSLDSEQFSAAPMTTGGLKAYYLAHGRQVESTHIEIVHFLAHEAVQAWKDTWRERWLPLAEQALAAGITPVAGFSIYTWNAAEFLDLMHTLRQSCPGLLIVAGGPHVQQPEEYLREDGVDVIALGEGEATFTELLDAPGRDHWPEINGLAYLDQGQVRRTASRARTEDLDTLPSALDVIPLTGPDGLPLYDSIAYETSRGCPYKCAFCEWGTGAIGGKMYQASMERIQQDWERIIAAGIQNIWLADSNFGALKDDLAKARLVVDLKARTGLPKTFATSWSKKHSPRVQEIVLLLNRHGLLPHYQLALQTLTPLALQLSNRQNMAANKYEPIAKQMAEQGVPIAAELIWGLPGDNLVSFEAGLDRLLATFPFINIFGYTLLPGTEFYARREEYQIDAIPVAGYGKAKGEYVVGCHTFSRQEGMEGYFLITAHTILCHGYLMPLTARFLALDGRVPVSALLRQVLSEQITAFAARLDGLDASDRMAVYEQRSRIFLCMAEHFEQSAALMRDTVDRWLATHGADDTLRHATRCVMLLDSAFAPRWGERQDVLQNFDFAARRLHARLEALDLPEQALFTSAGEVATIRHPGGVGSILHDPNGGSWLKGEWLDEPMTIVTDADVVISMRA